MTRKALARWQQGAPVRRCPPELAEAFLTRLRARRMLLEHGHNWIGRPGAKLVAGPEGVLIKGEGDY